MGLRIFSNGIHCSTVNSLLYVSSGCRESITNRTYKLERKMLAFSAKPRYTNLRKVFSSDRRI